jgi:hypothetical protein
MESGGRREALGGTAYRNWQVLARAWSMISPSKELFEPVAFELQMELII